MYFTLMFREIPWSLPKWRELYGSPQIRDYDQFLQVLNYIVRRAPAVDLNLPPMASVFARPMATMRYAGGPDLRYIPERSLAGLQVKH